MSGSVNLALVLAAASIVCSTLAWLVAAQAYRVNHPNMRTGWLWLPQLVYFVAVTCLLVLAWCLDRSA